MVVVVHNQLLLLLTDFCCGSFVCCYGVVAHVVSWLSIFNNCCQKVIFSKKKKTRGKSIPVRIVGLNIS